MKPALIGGIIVAVIVVVAIGLGSMFSVHQTQQALALRFGEPIRVITQPGLNTKWPLIDGVVYIDKRVLDLEAPVQEVIASHQKRLIVDALCDIAFTTRSGSTRPLTRLKGPIRASRR